MLLKSLYDFAVSHKLLDDLAFKKGTPVRFIIHLDKEGRCLGVTDTAIRDTQPRGASYDTPKSSRPAVSGTVADFLVDEISAVFGLNSKPEKSLNPSEAGKLRGKHADFWRQVEEAAVDSTIEPEITRLLKVLIAFHSTQPAAPFTLWTLPLIGRTLDSLPFAALTLKQKTSRTGETKPVWEVRTMTGESVEIGAGVFTFDVDNVRLITDERIRRYWLKCYENESANAEESSQRGVCLVTAAENVALARSHPMVEGLPKPARGTGAGLVSGEGAAFLSYGFERAYNAPTSLIAAKSYVRALQHMKGSEDHFYSVGPAWVMFWTDKTPFSIRTLLQRPNAQAVRSFLQSPWAGADREPSTHEKFYCVTLTAAGPRLVVKDWIQMGLNDAVASFRKWFDDLEIETIDYGPAAVATTPAAAARRRCAAAPANADEAPAPYSIFNLAKMTVRPNSEGLYGSKELEKLDANDVRALYAAALHGSAPPVSLLKPLLDRLRARMAKDGGKALREHSRFAFLKLILLRNPDPTSTMNITPKLAETDDAAYNCGRLLSILAEAQRKAHDYKLTGPTVAEKYFGAASASPASVLPFLVNLNRHHLRKISRSDQYKGDERFLEEELRNVLTMFRQTAAMELKRAAPEYPRSLTLREQGRFTLGFYQQEASRAESIRLRREAKAKRPSETSQQPTTSPTA